MNLSEKNQRFIEVVGNASRIKILLALWRSGEELRVYRICRQTGLERSSARRHLDNLVDNGLVNKKIYGQIALYSVNKDNPRLNALVTFFKETRL